MTVSNDMLLRRERYIISRYDTYRDTEVASLYESL